MSVLTVLKDSSLCGEPMNINDFEAKVNEEQKHSLLRLGLLNCDQIVLQAASIIVATFHCIQ
jgi:hypothetical protein